MYHYLLTSDYHIQGYYSLLGLGVSVFVLPFCSRGFSSKFQTGQKGSQLVKNLQLLFYPNETWSKWLPCKLVILTKFHKDRTKIVDFSLILTFLGQEFAWTASSWLLQSHDHPSPWKRCSLHISLRTITEKK